MEQRSDEAQYDLGLLTMSSVRRSRKEAAAGVGLVGCLPCGRGGWQWSIQKYVADWLEGK